MGKAKVSYVDGFVIAIPKKNTAKYKEMALEASRVWKRFGALDYKECAGDDLHPSMGGMPMLPFPKMIRAKKNENVWFSYIGYKSRKHRDQVNKKVMAYFAKKYGKHGMEEMPFDMKRFAYGGFKVVVD